MSAAGDEVLDRLILRTSTPAPSEKVLLYLEKMSRDGPMSPESPPSAPPSDIGDAFGLSQLAPARAKSPRSVRSGAPSAKGSRMGAVRRNTEDDLAASKISWNNMNGQPVGQARDVDVDSNIQEGSQSEVGHREPGPEDEPHGFYPSYGSSWGNMGPLPNSRHNSYQVPPPNGTTPAEIPLPMSVTSPRTTTINIGVDLASNPPRSRSQAASRASQKTRSIAPEEAAGDAVRSTKAPSASGKSHVSRRSRGGALDGIQEATEEARSTVSKATSRKPTRAASHISMARSLAPSDSQSIVAMKRYTAEAQAAAAPAPAPAPARSVSQSNGEAAIERAASPAVRSAAARSQKVLSPNPSRAFSPHRHAATSEDLFQAAMRNAAASPVRTRAPSVVSAARSSRRAPTVDPADVEGDITPTPSRPDSPAEAMTVAEEKVVREFLSRTPNRTSYAPSALEPEIENTHYHDMELCVLLHALDDPNQHEIAKKALRKGVRQRVKRLGMKYDNESIKQLRKSFHDHDPSVHLIAQMTGASGAPLPQDPPDWAKEIMQGLAVLSGRVEGLGPKIESIRSSQNGSYMDDGTHGYTPSERERYAQSPGTQTVHIQTQATGTMAESVFQAPDTEFMGESTAPGQTVGSMHHHDGSTHGMREDDEYDDETQHRGLSTRDDETNLNGASEYMDGREASPGQQYLEEELYKLRVRPGGSQSEYTHKTWEVAREDGEYDDDDDDEHAAITESGMPEIPGSQPEYTELGRSSPPLPPIPQEQQTEGGGGQMLYDDYADEQLPPPWQRIHQRLLSWAIVWPKGELDAALNSTTRGSQVDEVALSIWSTQTYKRYVRSKMTDSPKGRVDRLFVPPNMADAISNAVYNGRHGDACAMLRDLWNPFGLEGMPRLLIVLAKHRSDENHWVVHRFSLPEGTLTTYDTYPERCLPDGRPLGWWFAIRIAWPNAIYPSPDHLMQKMVRLHRPMQLGIDNSVAAAGIWRNLLMGSRAERSLDLERLRDLINTEVKNLRQRKHMGKLSIGSPNPRTNWFD